MTTSAIILMAIAFTYITGCAAYFLYKVISKDRERKASGAGWGSAATESDKKQPPGSKNSS